MFVWKKKPAPVTPVAPLASPELAAIRRSQAVIEFALDGTILDANDNFLAVMGYRLDEVVGRHHRIFVDPILASSLEYAQFWERLSAGEFFAAEFKRLAKGGKQIWIQGAYNPVFDAEGRPFKIIKFATDITANKMQSADDRGQLAAIGTTQAVITFTLDGHIISANPLFCQAVGYAEGEIVGQHHSIFVRPEERTGAAYRQFWQALEAGQCMAGEFCRVDRNRREIWLQASYTPILDPDGNPFKVVKYATVITERVEQQQKFNLLSLVADGTDNSVVITDRDQRIIYVNDGFQRLTGYTMEQVRGKVPGRLLQGARTDEATVSRIRERLAAGKPIYDEILNYNSSGEPYWISLAINPVRDASGRIENFISIQANITPTKLASLQYNAKLDAIGTSMAIAEWGVEGLHLASNAFLESRPAPKLQALLQPESIAELLRGRPVRREVTWPGAKDRAPIVLDAMFTVMTDLEGQAEKIVMCAVDVTPRQQAIAETSGAMKAMLGRVSTVCSTLDKVARITNLLAFNAAVEAARAGEAGRGFNVVATEVGVLASQSAEAVAEIRQLIDDGHTQVAQLGAKIPEHRAAA
ncbi:PAS domain S-box protein [Sphingomonas sp.]|uniref:methyl-accepting chemotaxis protein n=1 Tax=Sphingomonas sp. TaxID=28214 RepID=UPI002ED8C688